MTRPDLLSAEQVAAMTTLPDDGTGPQPIRVGRQLVYRRTEVEAWIAQRDQSGGAE